MDKQELLKAMKTDELCEHLAQTLVDAAEMVRKLSQPEYKKLFLDVHTSIWGVHFNESLAEKAVANMVNADGTKGESYPKDVTDALLTAMKGDYNEWDWYYVVNMMASDYCQIFRNDKTAYSKLANAYLSDTDGKEGRAFIRYVWENEV